MATAIRDLNIPKPKSGDRSVFHCAPRLVCASACVSISPRGTDGEMFVLRGGQKDEAILNAEASSEASAIHPLECASEAAGADAAADDRAPGQAAVHGTGPAVH